MNPIQAAKFVRMEDRDNRNYLDVEVLLPGRETPLLASFAVSGGQPELAYVYGRDSSQVMDGHGHSRHEAFVDLTAEMFDNGRGELFLGSRDDFTEAVLSWPEVKREAAPYITEYGER